MGEGHYMERRLSGANSHALSEYLGKGLTNRLDAGGLRDVLEGCDQQGLRRSRLRRNGWCLSPQCWRPQAQHTDNREGAEHSTIIATSWAQLILESLQHQPRAQEFRLSSPAPPSPKRSAN